MPESFSNLPESLSLEVPCFLPNDLVSGSFCLIILRMRGQRIVFNKLTLPSSVLCMYWKIVSAMISLAVGLSRKLTFKQLLITSDNLLE